MEYISAIIDESTFINIPILVSLFYNNPMCTHEQKSSTVMSTIHAYR